MEPLWHQTSVSSCETYHLFKDYPCYQQRFHKVLKFHAPGYAAVQDPSGAYHIDLKGESLYEKRFLKSFGFYFDYAAVETSEGWCHVRSDSSPLYNQRYAWCGNFQENVCVVKDKTGLFFHIDSQGNPLYSEKYLYAGDFKDGFAVICNHQGHHTHINLKGEYLHNKWFKQLDIFHKGIARARDAQGWFHIDRKGNPLYEKRFAQLENFYNGIAHVEQYDGFLSLMNEKAEIVTSLTSPQQDYVGHLSNDMVGFWKTQVICAAVRLGIPDFLPAYLQELEEKMGIPKDRLLRLLRALWEIDIVQLHEHSLWVLTDKGKLLTPASSSFMAAAAKMWADVSRLSDWQHLASWIEKTPKESHLSFKEKESDSRIRELYDRALKGYSKRDFKSLSSHIDWNRHSSIITIGRSGLSVLETVLEHHPHLQGYYFNFPVHEETKNSVNLQPQKRLKVIDANPFNPWPLQTDAILLPRYLHYWDDIKCLQILKQARCSLLPKGVIYIAEMVLKLNSPIGGLLDLNMLIETGGMERSDKQWLTLFKEAGLTLQSKEEILPYLSLFVIRNKEE
jgi:hypothetical protein